MRAEGGPDAFDVKGGGQSGSAGDGDGDGADDTWVASVSGSNTPAARATGLSATWNGTASVDRDDDDNDNYHINDGQGEAAERAVVAPLPLSQSLTGPVCYAQALATPRRRSDLPTKGSSSAPAVTTEAAEAAAGNFPGRLPYTGWSDGGENRNDTEGVSSVYVDAVHEFGRVAEDDDNAVGSGSHDREGDSDASSDIDNGDDGDSGGDGCRSGWGEVHGGDADGIQNALGAANDRMGASIEAMLLRRRRSLSDPEIITVSDSWYEYHSYDVLYMKGRLSPRDFAGKRGAYFVPRVLNFAKRICFWRVRPLIGYQVLYKSLFKSSSCPREHVFVQFMASSHAELLG